MSGPCLLALQRRCGQIEPARVNLRVCAYAVPAYHSHAEIEQLSSPNEVASWAVLLLSTCSPSLSPSNSWTNGLAITGIVPCAQYAAKIDDFARQFAGYER